MLHPRKPFKDKNSEEAASDGGFKVKKNVADIPIETTGEVGTEKGVDVLAEDVAQEASQLD